MLFGKHVNKYYKKYWYFFLIGIVTLVVVDVAQTFIPRYLGQIIDNDNQLIADLSKLGGIVASIMVCAVIMFVGRAIWRLTIFRASTGISAGLRKEMFDKAEKLSASFYQENKVGNVMNYFTSDIEEIGEFFGWGTVMIVDAVFLSVSVIVSMLRLNPWMTLLAAFPIILIIIWGALVDKIMSSRWQRRQKEYDKLYDFAQENFTGIRVIKSFVKQNQEFHAFAKIARKNKDVNVEFARISVIFDVIIEFIIGLEVAFIMGMGGWFIYAAATGNPIEIFGNQIRLTVGELVEFLGYIDLIIWPMIALGQIISMRSRAKGSLKRIGEFLDTKFDVINPVNGIVLSEPKGEIKFRDFTFSFPGNQTPSLEHITLTIAPGEHVGIVGKVGSGKTTIVNSLFRLYNVERDHLFIDGVDIMDCDIPSLRDTIAYAPQDNFLFSDKIENNIAFCVDEPDHEKVVEAAEFADVAENINGFPKGYDTISGERGVTLSGGQKQRISIARAYYKQAPVLVMDDCVSAVDVKTEERILANIASLRKGKTTLLIASRVSSVMHMDKIIVLDNGKLEGFGTHEELMKASELYRKMVHLQELEKEVEGGERHG